ncbi:hypothetical protein BDZ89DRAFT_1056963 [Hymenopellis radicata]|nr:hypothetical protein BDZ89DRAFT_1056963 [Hymenopellis radicata]
MPSRSIFQTPRLRPERSSLLHGPSAILVPDTVFEFGIVSVSVSVAWATVFSIRRRRHCP